MHVIRAPAFPTNAVWLNTDRPLRFGHELAGQLVLLDFWTHCCLNCIHVLPDLAYLEEKYRRQPLTVIGVHANKFTAEGSVESIRAAIARNGVRHPVVVDEGHRIWDNFAVRSWPTLILISPEGRVIGQVSGEGHRKLLEKSIDRALADGRARGILAEGPLEIEIDHTSPDEARGATLSFPAKVLIDDNSRRLIIVDSNHHRVLITDWPDAGGHVRTLETIGTGRRGRDDGPFNQATFSSPQGAVLAGGGGVIYLADTENHLVRRIDLTTRRVTTLLGTGEQKFDPEAGKSGREQVLNSPWDLAIQGNRLYVAQAGQHQLFVTNLMTGMTEIAAGSGRENLRDDANALNAQLAQPSGLALDSITQRLYFADSETSAIRMLDLQQKSVTTLLGHGLFDFGDIDGDPATARLQHPLGLALAPNRQSLFIADTYNHKIKRLALDTLRIETIAGTGKRGRGEPGGPVNFFEPCSVAAAQGDRHDLFIADTNNHRIVRFNTPSGKWDPLAFES